MKKIELVVGIVLILYIIMSWIVLGVLVYKTITGK